MRRIVSAGSRTKTQRPNARYHCLKVRVEIAEDEGVLLAELIALRGKCGDWNFLSVQS